MIEHECPECGQSIESSDRLAGDQVICPECDASVMVPLLPTEAPGPPPLPPGEDTPPTANPLERVDAALEQGDDNSTVRAQVGSPNYLLAVAVCVAEGLAYVFVGALLGWKRGGGILPMMILFAVWSATWAAIAKRPTEDNTSSDLSDDEIAGNSTRAENPSVQVDSVPLCRRCLTELTPGTSVVHCEGEPMCESCASLLEEGGSRLSRPTPPTETPSPPPLPNGEDTPPTANLMELTGELQQKGAEDRKADTEHELLGEPRGIGGWLIIPAVVLVLKPIMSVLVLFMGMATSQSITPILSNDPRLWFSGVIHVAMFVATIIVGVLFFNKRRIAVPAIIGLMVANILANIVQAFPNAAMFKEVDADSVKSVILAFVVGAIWIPYFVNSKRVKYTFTK